MNTTEIEEKSFIELTMMDIDKMLGPDVDWQIGCLILLAILVVILLHKLRKMIGRFRAGSTTQIMQND
jgi:hypothetical protein